MNGQVRTDAEQQAWIEARNARVEARNARVEAVVEALSEVLPGAAWERNQHDPRKDILRVGKVGVYIYGMADRIVDALDELL